MSTTPSSSPEAPASAGSREPQPVLGQFLADRDVPCPRCRYNLRGVASEACPECGWALILMLRDRGLARYARLALAMAFLWASLVGGFISVQSWKLIDTQYRDLLARRSAIAASAEMDHQASEARYQAALADWQKQPSEDATKTLETATLHAEHDRISAIAANQVYRALKVQTSAGRWWQFSVRSSIERAFIVISTLGSFLMLMLVIILPPVSNMWRRVAGVLAVLVIVAQTACLLMVVR